MTIYEPFNDTFRYNYSVDGIEYTEWRYSFSWDTETPKFRRTIFRRIHRTRTKTQDNRYKHRILHKTLTFTIEPYAYAEVLVHSQNDTFAASLANNFPEDSAASVRIN